jgi:hypothetical protein
VRLLLFVVMLLALASSSVEAKAYNAAAIMGYGVDDSAPSDGEWLKYDLTTNRLLWGGASFGAITGTSLTVTGAVTAGSLLGGTLQVTSTDAAVPPITSAYKGPSTAMLAVGAGTNVISKSTNRGASWVSTAAGAGTFTTGGQAIATNGSRWVAVGIGTNTIIYSDDNGASWSAATGAGVFATAGYGVCWNGSKFVAVGMGTSSVAYSADGATWTAADNVFSTFGSGVCWSGSKFVAVGAGTNSIAYSSDGISWTGIASGVGNFSTGGVKVCYGNGRFVAVGAGTNSIAYSVDGISWSVLASGVGNFSTGGGAVCWTGTRFVAVGSGTNGICYSAGTHDGSSWTPIALGAGTFTVGGNGVCWDGVRVVAVGSGTNTIIHSPDGITWTPVDTGANIFSAGGKGVATNNAPQLSPVLAVTPAKVETVYDESGNLLLDFTSSLLDLYPSLNVRGGIVGNTVVATLGLSSATLAVTGDSTLGAITGTSINISGACELGSLNINSSLGVPTLTADGAYLHIDDPLAITGNTSVSGNLDVTGSTTITAGTLSASDTPALKLTATRSYTLGVSPRANVDLSTTLSGNASSIESVGLKSYMSGTKQSYSTRSVYAMNQAPSFQSGQAAGNSCVALAGESNPGSSSASSLGVLGLAWGSSGWNAGVVGSSGITGGAGSDNYGGAFYAYGAAGQNCALLVSRVALTDPAITSNSLIQGVGPAGTTVFQVGDAGNVTTSGGLDITGNVSASGSVKSATSLVAPVAVIGSESTGTTGLDVTGNVSLSGTMQAPTANVTGGTINSLSAGAGSAQSTNPIFNLNNSDGTSFLRVRNPYAIGNVLETVNGAAVPFSLSASSLQVASGWGMVWCNASSVYNATDLGLSRKSAGVLNVNNGSTGVGGISCGTIDATGNVSASGNVKSATSLVAPVAVIGSESTGTTGLDVTGNVSLSGQLLLNQQAGTTSATGINFGDASANLYRSAASTLRTDGTFDASTLRAGYFVTDKASVGGNTTWLIRNTDNTNAGSEASIDIRTGGSNAGDPFTAYSIQGVMEWRVGVDNSDSDQFKISRNSGLGNATGNILALDANGIISSRQNDSYTIGNVYESTAGVSCTSTSGVTLIPTGVGSLAFPANFWTVGRTVRVKADGLYTTSAESNVFTIGTQLGTTDGVTATWAFPDSDTNESWSIEYDLKCLTAGASGVIRCSGYIYVSDNAGGAVSRRRFSGLFSRDTTAAATLQLTGAVVDGTDSLDVETLSVDVTR